MTGKLLHGGCHPSHFTLILILASLVQADAFCITFCMLVPTRSALSIRLHQKVGLLTRPRQQLAIERMRASAHNGGSVIAGVQTYFGEYVVRSFGDVDVACVKLLPPHSSQLLEECRATGGEVIVAERDQGELVAAAAARAIGGTAHAEMVFWSAPEDDVRGDLLTFLLRCLEAVCARRRELSVSVIYLAVSLAEKMRAHGLFFMVNPLQPGEKEKSNKVKLREIAQHRSGSIKKKQK